MYKNIKNSENLHCSHCGRIYIKPSLYAFLIYLDSIIDFDVFITSGFRCPEHPIEIVKTTTGTHSKGLAVDLQCASTKYPDLLKIIINYDFKGLGIKLKGDQVKKFIHIDFDKSRIYKTVWTY